MNVPGVLTITYTDASPTVAEFLSKLWSAYSEVAGASGFGTSDPSAFVTILHPRRHA